MTKITDKSQLEKLLRLFSIKIVRGIAHEKDLKFKSRDVDSLVDELVKMDWTQAEVNAIKELYYKIRREEDGISNFMSPLKNRPEINALAKKMGDFRVQLSADGSNVEKEGFGNLKYDIENKILECVHLRHMVKEEVSPSFDKIEVPSNPQVYLRIDCNKNRILFSSTNYGNVLATRSFLTKKIGLEFDGTKLSDLTSKQTKEKFEKFVETFEKRVRGIK
jgi:hypothetical protein